MLAGSRALDPLRSRSRRSHYDEPYPIACRRLLRFHLPPHRLLPRTMGVPRLCSSPKLREISGFVIFVNLGTDFVMDFMDLFVVALHLRIRVSILLLRVKLFFQMVVLRRLSSIFVLGLIAYIKER